MAYVCSLWLVGEGQCRAEVIYIRYIWQDAESFLFNSRRTASILLVCVNFLRGFSIRCTLSCHPWRASGIPGQTSLWRWPWWHPHEVAPVAQRGVLSWKKGRWAVASFQLSGSTSVISISAGMCSAKEENLRRSLEESPAFCLCLCPEWCSADWHVASYTRKKSNPNVSKTFSMLSFPTLIFSVQ